jgi:hypothetical protein
MPGLYPIPGQQLVEFRGTGVPGGTAGGRRIRTFGSPTDPPFFFEAAILSRMRSPMTSRSNCAKDNRTLRVKRPIGVVVLNCCVTETKEAPLVPRISTILAKSASERVSRSIL